MRSSKKPPNNEKLAEELCQSIGKELKDLRIKDMMRELQPQWKCTQPKHPDELTEDEQRAQAKEQAEAKREFVRGQRLLSIKQFLQSIIKAKSNDPNSKLFTTAEEILEFVVQYESNPSSVSNYKWNRFETVLLTRCEALLKAESKSEETPAETGRENKDSKKPQAEWVKVGEAARIADVSPGTITHWANEDKVTDNGKKNRMRRIEKTSLLVHMQKRREKERTKGYDEYSRELDALPEEH